MAPKDLSELEDMMEFAVGYKGPISIRYPRGGIINNITQNPQRKKIELGRAEVLKSGKDSAILAIGDMTIPSLKAADILFTDGVDAEVINMRFIKPIDKEIILNTADRIKKFVVVEDNILKGGFGSYVLEVLSENQRNDVEVLRLGIPDEFMAHAKKEDLLSEVSLSPEAIAREVFERQYGKDRDRCKKM
jgi:1-deoxy-D-xylulose-5-phosphate synthase